MSDYLFDRDGAPDSDVAQLERLLGSFEYVGAPPRLPRRRSRAVWIAAGALAAAAVLALLVLRPWRPGPRVEPAAPPSWAATVLGDGATADGRPFAGEARLAVGAWLETGASRVRLRAAELGTVELSPGTRARLVATAPERHEVELARGTLAAEITAPPRRFFVDTAHAIAADLGCAFQLTVDEAGQGRLVVSAGSVAVSDRGARELVVPAGAQCDLTAHGPGAPYLSDAGADFHAALARYAADGSGLRELLAAARPKDSFTLRQLLPAASGEARALLLERLRQLDPAAPSPAPVEPTPKHPAQKIKKSTSYHKTPLTSPAHNTEPTRDAAPTRNTAPARKTDPARKADPGVKIQHDALQDLERSAPQ
ncbi:MAG TPA: FecR domain-containing protein [Polyangia bacterium]|nr:FecR domain-containing protein [Polyangia bacterium]